MTLKPFPVAYIENELQAAYYKSALNQPKKTPLNLNFKITPTFLTNQKSITFNVKHLIFILTIFCFIVTHRNTFM